LQADVAEGRRLCEPNCDILIYCRLMSEELDTHLVRADRQRQKLEDASPVGDRGPGPEEVGPVNRNLRTSKRYILSRAHATLEAPGDILREGG
jgi:hypothetical protein